MSPSPTVDKSLLSRHLAAQANDPERLQFWNVKAQDCPVLLKAASDSAPVRML